MTDFQSEAVAKVFSLYPKRIRQKLLAVREMIFEVAMETQGVGELQETLKWGEPAYVTAESGSGSTIRINQRKGSREQYAIYFHCQTTLIDTFRTLFPETFTFEGNRAIVFRAEQVVPRKELECCIHMALTYHQRKTVTASRSRTSRSTRTGEAPLLARRR